MGQEGSAGFNVLGSEGTDRAFDVLDSVVQVKAHANFLRFRQHMFFAG